MASDLNIDAELKQPIAIKKDADNQDTKGLEEIESIPEDVSMRGFQLPFDEGADTVVNGKPKT
jgi:hypothetical protein